MSSFSRKSLVIATRKSKLALWQAEFVRHRLMTQHPGLTVTLLPMTTEGDERLDVTLSKIGGKGLFVKELETALLSGAADLAVHSIKDMPAQLHPTLAIGAICAREDVRDVLIANNHQKFMDLAPGAHVGTSSLRRQVQLKKIRPDLQYLNLRGNVPTRVQKLKSGEYDAIVLAAAGLKRLGLEQEITEYFSIDQVLPACGQGALGIECRADDSALMNLLQGLHENETAACVQAERAMNAILGGSCQVPIAALARYQQQKLHLMGRVGDLAGAQSLAATASGLLEEAEQIGQSVAELLIQQGAKQIIDEILSHGFEG
ncbi:MAG: hydroxymethylbilane synthase [Gammaproteobacteria bacterium]